MTLFYNKISFFANTFDCTSIFYVLVLNYWINMKILILSENNSVFDDNSLTRVKILEYASLVSMLFVIVTTSYKKKSIKIKEINKNTWLYQTNSVSKFLHIWDVIKLASFELKNKNIFQPEVVVSEAQLTSALAGYFLCRKFKRPLYISLSVASENKFFAPVGLKNFMQAKIIYLVLLKADCIQVDSVETKEKLRKKFGFKNHTIQLIKPVLDADMLLASSRTLVNKEKIGNTFIQKKFPDSKFTAVAFVDNAEQVRFSLEILKKMNEHFPPISLILLPSYNIKISRVNHLIKKRFKSFVRIENIDEDLCEYLTSANVFFGISDGFVNSYRSISRLANTNSYSALFISNHHGDTEAESSASGNNSCHPSNAYDLVVELLSHSFWTPRRSALIFAPSRIARRIFCSYFFFFFLFNHIN